MRSLADLEEAERLQRFADPDMQARATVLPQFGFSAILLLIPRFVTDAIAFYLIARLLSNSSEAIES